MDRAEGHRSTRQNHAGIYFAKKQDAWQRGMQYSF